MASRCEAWTLDLLLRHQAARWPVALDGRARSADALNAFFDAAVGLVDPETFAEIGAFEAAASVRVKAAHPACTVVAFEASPQVHAHHASRTDYAALGVDYRNAAVADRGGSIELNVGSGTDVGSSSTAMMSAVLGSPSRAASMVSKWNRGVCAVVFIVSVDCRE